MHASPAWRHHLLRHNITPGLNVRACVGLRSSSRGVASSAVRRNSQPTTPAESSQDTVDAKGKGKEVLDAASARDKELDLPYLQRPLGVSEMPSRERRSWREEMMDQETRMDHRKKLIKEATKGYFQDLTATKHHGGKTWIAPPVLIRESKALYFPDIEGTPLDKRETVHTTDLCLGKVSLISILSSQISEAQTRKLAEPTVKMFKDHSHFQHIQINLQENRLKSLLVSMFAASIRKTIPQEQWRHYLISSQNMDYLREDLGLNNKYIAFNYLVDTACRIRWAVCGEATAGEIDSLAKCATVLLKRLKP